MWKLADMMNYAHFLKRMGYSKKVVIRMIELVRDEIIAEDIHRWALRTGGKP